MNNKSLVKNSVIALIAILFLIILLNFSNQHTSHWTWHIDQAIQSQ